MRTKLATPGIATQPEKYNLQAQLEERKAMEAALQLSQAQFGPIFNAWPRSPLACRTWGKMARYLPM